MPLWIVSLAIVTLTASIASAGLTFSEPDAFVDGSWTMVVIPDTQYYSQNDTDAAIFRQMTQWIVDNKASRNIGLVAHVGDIVEANRTTEWMRSKTALVRLDGKVPYILSVGNHDYTLIPDDPVALRNSTQVNAYFPSRDDASRGGMLGGTYEADRIENAYYEFTAPDGRKMLIFSLEFAPRQEVIDWANEVAKQESFRDHTAFVVTHAYLERDGTRFAWDMPGSEFGTDVNDGQAIWEELVRGNENFEGVLSGHISGMAYSPSVGDQGNVVHQILFDSQYFGGNGGDGWLRLLEFLPDGRTVRAKTYSPYLDGKGWESWQVDESNYFEFELSPLAENVPEPGMLILIGILFGSVFGFRLTFLWPSE